MDSLAHWSVIDEDPPNTSDIIKCTDVQDGYVDVLGFPTFVLGTTVSSVKLWLYCRRFSSVDYIKCKYSVNAGVAWSSQLNITPAGWAWRSVKWTGLSLSQAELDALQIRVQSYCPTKWNSGVEISTMYVEITESAAAGWSAGDPTGVDVATVGKIKGVAIADIGEFIGV